MIVLPDGVKIEMQWKQVTYIKGDNYIVFEIIPMLAEKDIVVFPDFTNWTTRQDVFSVDERAEIIFLLERIAWKRDICVVEMDVPPYVNKKLELNQGMLELTQGYAMLTKENLFDVDSKLNKEQVKAVYCKLEKRFAELAQGVVRFPNTLLLKGSVLAEIVVPELEKSNKVKVVYY
ncbi:hypothetical protein [Thomasclavelia cocleata]|uniref:hypothetical protein n=1 Tax=Thomasclavelia cocleata TaxID=69824 RepID=UPI0025AD609B|nr:hypothetical protein [Thomasclavelia cocleata]